MFFNSHSPVRPGKRAPRKGLRFPWPEREREGRNTPNATLSFERLWKILRQQSQSKVGSEEAREGQRKGSGRSERVGGVFVF